MKGFKFKLNSELRFKDNKEEIPNYTYTVGYPNNNEIFITWAEKDENITTIKCTKTTQEEIDRNIGNGAWIIVEE